jgi:hypothetical protein
MLEQIEVADRDILRITHMRRRDEEFTPLTVLGQAQDPHYPWLIAVEQILWQDLHPAAIEGIEGTQGSLGA